MTLSAYEWFNAAERFELLAAEAYRRLAERFAANASARALFAQLHDEEIQHAARVRLLASQYRNDPTLFGAAALGPGLPDPKRLMVQGELALREIDAGAWDGDLARVKLRLMALEDEGAKLHAEIVAATAAPEVAEFFAALARQDLAHEMLLAGL